MIGGNTHVPGGLGKGWSQQSHQNWLAQQAPTTVGAQRPSGVTAGSTHYDTNTNTLYMYDGTQWQAVQSSTAQQARAVDVDYCAYKATAAIDKLIAALPFRVVGKIMFIYFDAPKHIFQLDFKTGRQMFFDEPDVFPTDADIARVCLESAL